MVLLMLKIDLVLLQSDLTRAPTSNGKQIPVNMPYVA